ncbi:hypothetical protein ACG33_00705 [Steroidobacter denitrificans]|uniref:Peptidase M12B domain-containing protein n=1 Tax=Steroidobacter denitrificans TaxID=465721 RepID=A0A127F5E7_STEDE|nr:M12 family metallo-peptidase [Steroidobacter denitrificans]AMN45647.1 hypothetical protein ACG33_00705 [Steroidobacter denitrificans]
MQFRRASGAARHLGWLYAVIGVLAAPTLQAADTSGIDASRPQVLYFESLPALRTWAGAQPQAARDDAHTGTAAKTQALASSDGEHRLHFDAYGRRFELSLETNARLNGLVQSKSAPSSLSLYRGTLDGNPRSWVRLAAMAGEAHGMIWDGTDLYVIEPAQSNQAQSNQTPISSDDMSDTSPAATSEPSTPVIFRLADVLMEPGTAACAVHAGPTDEESGSAQETLEDLDPDAANTGNVMRGDAAYGALLGELKDSAVIMQAAGATRRLTLSALGDAQFLQRYLERGLTMREALDAILIRLNNVDGIYSTQLQIELQVEAVSIDHSLGTMLSDPVQPQSLLEALGERRRNSPEHRSRGLTHLFTGRDLDGNTVGIAYVDSLCSSRYGVALTQVRGSAWQDPGSIWHDTLVAAHEIGHNFGAPHDGDPEEVCRDAPPGYLMAPAINALGIFSECSLEQMNKRALAARCISPLPPAGAPASQTQAGSSSGGGSLSIPFLLGLLGILVLRPQAQRVPVRRRVSPAAGIGHRPAQLETTSENRR